MEWNDNTKNFHKLLSSNYQRLFDSKDPDYVAVMTDMSPDELATKMTESLLRGTANKDGKGIKWTCRNLKINHTYKAITKFLTTESVAITPADYDHQQAMRNVATQINDIILHFDRDLAQAKGKQS